MPDYNDFYWKSALKAEVKSEEQRKRLDRIAALESELSALRAERDAIRARTIEECAVACEQQASDFASPEYATGQPLSSFKERFACNQCAVAIRALENSDD